MSTVAELKTSMETANIRLEQAGEIISRLEDVEARLSHQKSKTEKKNID